MSYVQRARDEAAREMADRNEYYHLAYTELYELGMALQAMPKPVRFHRDFRVDVVWAAIQLLTEDEREQEWAEDWIVEFLRNV